MDANQFDARTTHLAAHLSRRRGLGALMALGLGASVLPGTTEARKKRKKKITLCQNGQTIKVKKRKYKQKYPGATVGACPACTPTTCAAQGKTCGPLADGCGRTLVCGACGMGDTPSCRNTGVCGPCFGVCPPSCNMCANRSDGGTTCANIVDFIPCTACATDADCPGTQPTCVSTTTTRAGAGTTTSLPALCSLTSPGVCAAITPC